MTATIWWTVAGCTLVTLVIKAAGPVALGGRDLPPRLVGVITLMASALLAALVATSTFADGDQWRVGAHTVGVGVAGVVLLRGGRLLVAVATAVAVTATLRAVT